MTLNRQQVIDFWRERQPGKWSGVSDDDLYNQVMEGFSPPEAVAPREQEYNPNKSIAETDTSPGLISRIATWGLSEAFTEEGGLGWSPEFWKETYNKSLAGVTYQAIHGKTKYEDVD